MSTNQRGVPVEPMTVRELEAEIDRLRAELAEADEHLETSRERWAEIHDVVGQHQAENLDRALRAEAAIARVREPLDNLMGYLNWHDGTLGSRFRPENVRALTWKALLALDGGTE